jgi:hypothetical protein
MVTDESSMYKMGMKIFLLIRFNSSKYQLNVADHGFLIRRRWHVPHVGVVLNVEVLLVFVGDRHVRQTFAPQAEEHEGRQAERYESDDRRKEKDCPGKSVGRNLVKKKFIISYRCNSITNNFVSWSLNIWERAKLKLFP